METNDISFRVGSEDSTCMDFSAAHDACRIQVPAQFGGLVLG